MFQVFPGTDNLGVSRVSPQDKGPGYLEDKLASGQDILISKQDLGDTESLLIDVKTGSGLGEIPRNSDLRPQTVAAKIITQSSCGGA